LDDQPSRALEGIAIVEDDQSLDRRALPDAAQVREIDHHDGVGCVRRRRIDADPPGMPGECAFEPPVDQFDRDPGAVPDERLGNGERPRQVTAADAGAGRRDQVDGAPFVAPGVDQNISQASGS
jgi:hypothetical protein